jgi:hypothetical protein
MPNRYLYAICLLTPTLPWHALMLDRWAGMPELFAWFTLAVRRTADGRRLLRNVQERACARPSRGSRCRRRCHDRTARRVVLAFAITMSGTPDAEMKSCAAAHSASASRASAQ